MARRTVDIDDAVLRDLERLQKRDGKSLGQLISEMVGASLGRTHTCEAPAQPLQWTTRAMGARVDLENKEAVRAALDLD
jgi:hypothetical protein